jgi:hypothetical protein
MKRTKDTKRLKSTKYIHLYLFACLTSLFSCTRPDRLEEALLMAGNNRAELEYAYLCVFDNQQWMPVQYGEIRRGKVLYKDMGNGKQIL